LVKIAPDLLAALNADEAASLFAACDGYKFAMAEIAAERTRAGELAHRHRVLCTQRNACHGQWADPGATSEDRDATHGEFSDLTGQIAETRAAMAASADRIRLLAEERSVHDAAIKSLCRLGAQRKK